MAVNGTGTRGIFVLHRNSRRALRNLIRHLTPKAAPPPKKDWLNRIRTIAEIAALVIGGAWAFTRFWQESMPSLEHRVSLQGELKWSERSRQDCLGEYTVTFKNIGKTRIDLPADPRLRVWVIDEPNTKENITFLDHEEWTKGKQPTIDRPVKDFGRRFAPDVADSVGLSVRTSRQRGYLILFRIDFPFPGRPKQMLWVDPWYHHYWDYICGEAPGGQKSSAASPAGQNLK